MTVRIPADRTQDTHIEGLTLGTRGGGVLQYTFPRDGLYEVQVRLARDRDEQIEGLSEAHEVDFLLDRKRMHRTTISPPPGGVDFTNIDKNLNARFHVRSGTHEIGVTFPQRGSSLLEIRRQPFDAAFNRHRHPRREPAIFEISVVGPFESSAPGDSNSRRLLFEGIDTQHSDQEKIATQTLSRWMERAYRRPLTIEDLDVPMRFFRESIDRVGFDGAMQSVLAAVLVNPHFLFRIEHNASIDAVDRKGQTALMWAAFEGNIDAVNLLMENGANPRISTKSGFSAIHFAARNGHWPVIKRLVAAGVNINEALTPANSFD